MQQWLKMTAELVSCRDESKLTAVYLNSVLTHWRLSHCCLLTPSEDGRHLLTCRNQFVSNEQCGRAVTLLDDQGSCQWDVNDFEHPFAHVLQQATTMLLDRSKLAYWQQNQAFTKLASLAKGMDNVLIAPITSATKQVVAIAVLIGEQSITSELLTDQNWSQFSDLFVSQRQLLKDMQHQQTQKAVLNESLSRLKSRQSTSSNGFSPIQQLIGSSSAMESLREQIEVAAKSNLTVLIQGETGVGKELVAKAVHALSDRKDQNFVVINCAAIPENLLESELFGYEKGAFTGAHSSRKGLIAQADGGTLFLDEMGELPLSLQAKLLRVMEAYQYRPLGANQEQTSNFRLIAATHVNLRRSVNEGRFRQDLYYRLYQYPLSVPNLQSRLQDIEELATYFIELHNSRENRHVIGLASSTLDALKQLDYPGNVRELRSLVEYACVHTGSGKYIEQTALPSKKWVAKKEESQSTPETLPHFSGIDLNQVDDLKAALEQIEKQIICERLRQYGGHRAKAAESLGLPKRTLAHKCQKLEIQI